MTETKFTPGEWHLDRRQLSRNIHKGIAVVDSGGNVVGYVRASDDKCDWVEEAIANAHLIAAAPEMYEVLCDTLNALERDMCEEYDARAVEAAIREILAKARGEGCEK